MGSELYVICYCFMGWRFSFWEMRYSAVSYYIRIFQIFTKSYETHYATPQLAEWIMVDLWRDFWVSETGTGQQVAQLLDRYMMMMKRISVRQTAQEQHITRLLEDSELWANNCVIHIKGLVYTGSFKKIFTSSTLATEVTRPDTLWFFPMGIR